MYESPTVQMLLCSGNLNHGMTSSKTQRKKIDRNDVVLHFLVE